MKNWQHNIFAKDFIETAEGLIFAVVQNGIEEGKVLCFLRYIYDNKHWQKIGTEQANQVLQANYPQYLHYSEVLDAFLHAVAVEKIAQHYQPKQRLQKLLQQLPEDEVSADLVALCQLFKQADVDLNHVGVTGSLLIGVQKLRSDIDLVFYQRASFQQARQITELLIQENKLRALTPQDWLEAFDRRDCELNFTDYVWHEQRKFNKAMINQRKFDLSLLMENQENTEVYSKSGTITLAAQISDDSYGFDYPARFLLNHPDIQEVLCFTATYNGQAQTREWVEVAGQLEISASGRKRIIVGSSREARGEYIKVLHS